MARMFEKEGPLREVLWNWWNGLDRHRADRAKLRRANSVDEVVCCDAYQRLYRRLLKAGWQTMRRGEFQDDYLAAAIGILVHVDKEKHQPGRSPVAAMSTLEGDKPAVSELRFLRLLESRDIDLFFTGMRRVLPLMTQSRVDVLHLADDIVYWSDTVRKNWAYGYDWPVKAGN